MRLVGPLGTDDIKRPLLSRTLLDHKAELAVVPQLKTGEGCRIR